MPTIARDVAVQAHVDLRPNFDRWVRFRVAPVSVHVVPMPDQDVRVRGAFHRSCDLPQRSIAVDVIGIEPRKPWINRASEALSYRIRLAVVALAFPFDLRLIPTQNLERIVGRSTVHDQD